MGRRRAAGLLSLAMTLASLPLVPGRAAEPVFQNSPARRTVRDKDWGPWLGPFRAQLIPSLMQDFGEKYIYAARDRALPPPRPGENRVVFLGDSITDRWNLARSFPGKPYINRGIGSQVTAQMVLRFHQDVVALHPAAVVILAGVNDVQGVLQQDDEQQIEANFEAMADMADRHAIRMVFASILPVDDYTPEARNTLAERHPDELRRINAWLRRFCAARGYVYADYYSALVGSGGLMRRGLSQDGVHPLAAGYAIMTPIAEAAIEKALTRSASAPHG